MRYSQICVGDVDIDWCSLCRRIEMFQNQNRNQLARLWSLSREFAVYWDIIWSFNDLYNKQLNSGQQCWVGKTSKYYMGRVVRKVPSSMRKMCGFSSSCACARSYPGLCSPLTHSVISNDSGICAVWASLSAHALNLLLFTLWFA